MKQLLIAGILAFSAQLCASESAAAQPADPKTFTFGTPEARSAQVTAILEDALQVTFPAPLASLITEYSRPTNDWEATPKNPDWYTDEQLRGLQKWIVVDHYGTGKDQVLASHETSPNYVVRFWNFPRAMFLHRIGYITYPQSLSTYQPPLEYNPDKGTYYEYHLPRGTILLRSKNSK